MFVIGLSVGVTIAAILLLLLLLILLLLCCCCCCRKMERSEPKKKKLVEAGYTVGKYFSVKHTLLRICLTANVYGRELPDKRTSDMKGREESAEDKQERQEGIEKEISG